MKSSLKIVAAAFLAIAAIACVKTEKNVEELPGEEVVLNLCPSGEILEVADEPLSKAGLPDGTLYVISVYQGTEKYAHGVFSDPSQMSIRLSTGKAFSIQVKAIKSGVTEIASASGVYEGNGLLDNQFHYYASDKTDEALYDNTSDISALESQWLLDTYYGATTLTPTAQTSSVNIMLYHMMHKLTVRVNGFEPTDGSVAFTQSPYLPGTAAITLTPDAAEYSKLAVINTNFEEVISAISGNSDYSRSIAFTAEYTSTVSGEPYTKKLIDAAQVTFRRNRETTLTLNLSHNYLGNITATITLTVEGDDMDVNEITFSGEIDTDASGGTTTPEAVDLGLSVKWASFNLGKDGLVNSPEEIGEYYAWGETESKNDYSWTTYKWGNRSSYIWKYGAIDGKTLLDSEDDAAQVILGGDWRMPTKEEWDEILNPDNCDCIRTSLNGVDGLKFTSKKEGYTGNWIFIPAAGRMSGTELQKFGVDMYCWASSVCSNPTSQAWDIKLWSDGDPFIDTNVRYYGNTIRPVYDPIAHQNISLSRSSLELAIGTSFMLSAIPSPENSTDVTFQWSTSNPSIASVDGGTVTAVSPGSAVITVTAVESGKSANCTVTVKNENLMISVDLGLSVIWATCNLGASIPEEIGNHYAWGEAQPRPSGFGDWSKYKYGSSSTSMTKYNNSSSYGTVDNKSTLEMVDDAARTLLGGSWRMPTKAEFDELVNGCTKSWVDRNGVPGVLLTSKKNGANIFFPLNALTQNEKGYYWSSSLYTSIPYNAWEFLFTTDNSKYGTYYGERFQGRSIRAVYK